MREAPALLVVSGISLIKEKRGQLGGDGVIWRSPEDFFSSLGPHQKMHITSLLALEGKNPH